MIRVVLLVVVLAVVFGIGHLAELALHLESVH